MASWSPFWLALGAVLAMMTLVWLASLILRDASVVDVFWAWASSSRPGPTWPRARPGPYAATSSSAW
jgi:hypothetical protein